MNIRTLAQAIGISHMTVSRALNGSPNVAPATRERVLALAREVGYELHGPARGLATGRTSTIGILYPFQTMRKIESWYTVQLMHDIRLALDATGYDSIIAGYDTTTKGVEDIARLLSQRKVDAVVVIGYEAPRGALETLSARGHRYICINSSEERWITNHPRIVIDQKLGGELAALALQHHGCTKIAVFLEESPQFLHRLEGFQRVWPGIGRITLIDGRYETAYDQTCAAIDDLVSTGVDGVFVGSDVSALGTLNALQDRGLTVPDDIAIVGYDDIEAAQYSRPSLTTIHQPRVRTGELIARWASRLPTYHNEKDEDQLFVQLLEPRVVVRGSCS